VWSQDEPSALSHEQSLSKALKILEQSVGAKRWSKALEQSVGAKRWSKASPVPSLGAAAFISVQLRLAERES